MLGSPTALQGDSTQKSTAQHPVPAGRPCAWLLTPGLPAFLLVKPRHEGWARCPAAPLTAVLFAGTWTLAELSEVLKVPVTSLKRKMTLWLQQGVLREEPPGTFTVIEEEQKDQGEKVVLIDSDEEGDSAMASQADQKEEELQVCLGACRAGGTVQTSNAFGFWGWI